jgi:sigma-E factor negative regulatory protein RseA
MTMASKEAVDRAERVSALVDGELGSAEAAELCGRWRDDALLRERWHDYQLIGDVLRSDDLASTASHSNDFLARLRERMADEPIVLAPAASAPAALPMAQRRARLGWRTGAAVAAGFAVVVAGTLGLNRLGSEPESGRVATAPPTTVAGTGGPAAGVVPVSDPPVAGETPELSVNGQLIRDARLDRYLAAHQQWSGGSVMGAHAGFLRRAAADEPKR